MTKQDILGPEQQLIEALNSKLDVAKGDFNVYDALRFMRQKMISELIDRLTSGTATHQELAIMTRLLKDNGLTLMPAEDPAPVMEQIGFTHSHVELPTFDEDEGEMDAIEELSPGSDQDARDSELD